MLIARLTDEDIVGGSRELLKKVNRYASRGILLDDKQNIALLYMSKIGYYKLPGGGIEGEETPEEAFLREIKEETGYEAVILEKLGEIEEHKMQNNFLQHSFCYLAQITSSNSATSLSENEKELGFQLVWMTQQDALEAMKHSLKTCTEYSMRFMLYRELTILEKIEKTKISS